MRSRKALWVLVSFLVVATTLFSACGTKSEETTSTTTTTTTGTISTPSTGTTTTTTTTTTEQTTSATPQYGGTLNYSVSADTVGFDEGLGVMPWYAHALHLTNEELLQPKWEDGPSGTKRLGFDTNSVASPNDWSGCIAESWELASPTTLIFHIREGIYWENKSPVNGRELTANDVVFSLKYNFETPTAYLFKTYPANQRPISISAPDKWTVVVECPQGLTGELLEQCGDGCRIIAPEVIEKYGSVKDWRNVIGSGPFVLSDYVPASAMRWTKNQNYWGTDPLNPGYKLPYLDNVNMFVIPDASTALAALRTGKSDLSVAVGWEDRADLRKTTPQLKESVTIADSPTVIFMRTDQAPFNDIKVRRALAMGINRQSLIDDYYEGNATLVSFPIKKMSDLAGCYTPFEELPADVQELYVYNPDKAKELLKEAGFPTGFQTSITLYSTPALIDLFTLVKQDLAKINVDLTLDVKEYAVWTSMTNSHNYTGMIYRYMSSSIPYKMYSFRTGLTQNMSIIDDPYINESYTKVSELYFDPTERDKLMKDVAIYAMQQAWMIPLPSTHSYPMWWPWVHEWEGAFNPGRNNHWMWPKWIWIDQEMKKEMTK
jgi:peptide/nickel transport system substrate-binding protein